MLLNQTVDALRSLPQLWLSGENTVIAMTEKKKRIAILRFTLNPLKISMQSPALTIPDSPSKVQEAGTDKPALTRAVNTKM